MSDEVSEESEFLMNKYNAFIESNAMGDNCFGHATNGIQQERYISVNSKSRVIEWSIRDFARLRDPCLKFRDRDRSNV